MLVTHDQQEALDIADSIAVLNKGRIEQVGSPTDLYDDPSNEFVFSFLGSVPTVNGQVVRSHDLRLERARREGALVAEITRGDAAALRLEVGEQIYVRPLRIADVEVADVEAGLAEQSSASSATG